MALRKRAISKRSELSDNSDEPMVSVSSPAIKPKNPPRNYGTDWARIMGALAFIGAHSFMGALNLIDHATPDSKEEKASWSDTRDRLEELLRIFMTFGLPMIFFISGEAAYHSRRHGFIQILKNKVFRLLVPLAVGYFFFVTPCAFVSRKYRPNMPDEDDFFLFCLSMWRNFTWHFGWLWTLPILFYLTTLYHIILKASASYLDKQAGYEIAKWEYATAFILLFVVNIGIYTHFGFGLWHTFANTVLPAVSFFVCSWAFNYVSSVNAKRGWTIVNFCLLVGITLYCAFTTDKYIGAAFPKCAANSYFCRARVGVTLFFFTQFYLLGFAVCALEKPFSDLILQWGPYRVIAPFQAFIRFCLAFGGLPGKSNFPAFVFTYPYYRTPVMTTMFVASSLCFISIFYHLIRGSHVNRQFSQPVMKHGSNLGMVIYLSHWLFIDISTVYIVQPYGFKVETGLLINYIFTICACGLLYFLSTFSRLIRSILGL